MSSSTKRQNSLSAKQTSSRGFLMFGFFVRAVGSEPVCRSMVTLAVDIRVWCTGDYLVYAAPKLVTVGEV